MKKDVALVSVGQEAEVSAAAEAFNVRLYGACDKCGRALEPIGEMVKVCTNPRCTENEWNMDEVSEDLVDDPTVVSPAPAARFAKGDEVSFLIGTVRVLGTVVGDEVDSVDGEVMERLYLVNVDGWAIPMEWAFEGYDGVELVSDREVTRVLRPVVLH